MKNKTILMSIALFLFGINLIAQPKKATDSKTIKTIKIGTQIWMAENLDVTTFRNGDKIIEAKTKEEWKQAYEGKKPAWCYYNNDPSNGAKYGKIYNWHAVNDARGLAPNGWNLPSNSDWNTLNLGLNEMGGKKMKSTSGWKENGNGTNQCGFAALPGGIRLGSSEGYVFSVIGSEAHFWSSTGATIMGFEFGNSFELRYDDDYLRDNMYDQEGLSVRCVKN
jgi:uncharacterized protein (TIGR02145 family)